MSTVKISQQPTYPAIMKVPSFISIADNARDRMLNHHRRVLLELAAMLFRLEALIIKTTPLTKEERLEKERISNIDLDMKMKELIPVYHGFLDTKTEGNKARQSLFKLARYVYKMEKEKDTTTTIALSSSSSSGGGAARRL
jgi:hypothetical protein